MKSIYGKGIPFEGNYSAWLEAKDSPPGAKKNASQRLAPQEKLEKGARVDSYGAQGSPVKGQGPRLANYDKLMAEAKEQVLRDEKLEIEIPANKRRLGEVVIEANELEQGISAISC